MLTPHFKFVNIKTGIRPGKYQNYLKILLFFPGIVMVEKIEVCIMQLVFENSLVLPRKDPVIIVISKEDDGSAGVDIVAAEINSISRYSALSNPGLSCWSRSRTGDRVPARIIMMKRIFSFMVTGLNRCLMAPGIALSFSVTLFRRA